MAHSWAQSDQLRAAPCACPALSHSSRAPRVSSGPGGTWSPSHTPAVRSGLPLPRHADGTLSALRPRRQAAADSQGVAAPRPAVTFQAETILLWALPVGCRTRREWNRRETCPLPPWPSSATAPPCLGVYFGLVLSSNKWLALGRRGDRDPEDPGGEHPPPLPFSCAPDPQDRPDLSQRPPR